MTALNPDRQLRRGDVDGTRAIPHVAPRTAKTLVDAGAMLLDVREHEEWCTEHAPTATLLPVGRVLARGVAGRRSWWRSRAGCASG